SWLDRGRGWGGGSPLSWPLPQPWGRGAATGAWRRGRAGTGDGGGGPRPFLGAALPQDGGREGEAGERASPRPSRNADIAGKDRRSSVRPNSAASGCLIR